jgi:hypothetical protein
MGDLIAIRGAVQVEVDSPCIVSVMIKRHNEDVLAVFIGDEARIVEREVRKHDILDVDGSFIDAEFMGLGTVFCIRKARFITDATTGRNLNAWA